MTDLEKLYKAADRLSHNALDRFLVDNAVDEEQYMVHRKRLLSGRAVAPASRKAKAKILSSQGGRCAFCRDPIPHGCQACYDQNHGDILCRRCTMGLVNTRALLCAGLTFDMIKERLGGDRDV